MNKDERLNIRVSADEYEQIKAAAEGRHLSISSYVRTVLLSEVSR